MALCIIREPGLVGRPHLAEPGAGDLEDLREPEAPPDLDELAARDDHLPAGRQGAERQDGGAGVVVDDGRGLGPGQPPEQVGDALRAPAAFPAGEVELEVAVTARHPCHGLDGLGGQGRPTQPGMEQDARGVEHGPERGPLRPQDRRRPPRQARRIDRGLDPGRQPTPAPRRVPPGPLAARPACRASRGIRPARDDRRSGGPAASRETRVRSRPGPPSSPTLSPRERVPGGRVRGQAFDNETTLGPRGTSSHGWMPARLTRRPGSRPGLPGDGCPPRVGSGRSCRGARRSAPRTSWWCRAGRAARPW